MFLSIIMPRGIKTNKREDRAVRLGQSLGIVLITPRKQNKHR